MKYIIIAMSLVTIVSAAASAATTKSSPTDCLATVVGFVNQNKQCSVFTTAVHEYTPLQNWTHQKDLVAGATMMTVTS